MRYQSTHWLMMTLGALLLPTVASAQDFSEPEGFVRLGGVRQTSCESGDCGTDISTYEIGGCDSGGCDQYGCDSCGCDSCGCDGYGCGNSCDCGVGCGCGRACRRDMRQDRRLIRRAKVQDWLSGGSYSRYGGCGNGACGYGACGQGACGYGGCHGRALRCGVCGSSHCCNPCHAKLMHTLHWLSPYHAGCKQSPDAGWAPPGHFPCQRVAATYRKWFPDSWTGYPSNVDPNFRYPMVYQPTDTTQLGYYYQRVPQWMPTRGMIPPTPHPDEFHRPDIGTCYNGVMNVGHGCPSGGCPAHGDVYSDVSSHYGHNGTYGESIQYDVQPSPVESHSAPMGSQPMPVIQPAPSGSNGGSGVPVNPGQNVPPAPADAPSAAPAPPAAAPERSAGAPTLYPVPTF
ncbi:MAG: hypothetical protein KDA93_17685 [Planctomycetaceae bacterium]|nr:hypothetical protein [Planctomycetaceae bacterium]